jgi:type IV secretion system protein VirB2
MPRIAVTPAQHTRCSIRASARLIVALTLVPFLAFAQASPFATGTTSLATNFLTIVTPFAVLGVIGLGVFALFDKISWSWVAAAIGGIVLIFGSTQIVDWVRGMFGV